MENNQIPSKEELVDYAMAAMVEGLPKNFQIAWLEYERLGSNHNKINYYCVIEENGNIEEFSPSDSFVPIKCIELMNNYLEEENKNWKKAILKFTPNELELDYEFDE